MPVNDYHTWQPEQALLAMSPQTTSLLFSVPPEIRKMIYESLYTSLTICIGPNTSLGEVAEFCWHVQENGEHGWSPIQDYCSLPIACQLLYLETHLLAFKLSTFGVRGLAWEPTGWSQIPVFQRDVITTIEIDLPLAAALEFSAVERVRLGGSHLQTTARRVMRAGIPFLNGFSSRHVLNLIRLLAKLPALNKIVIEQLPLDAAEPVGDIKVMQAIVRRVTGRSDIEVVVKEVQVEFLR